MVTLVVLKYYNAYIDLKSHLYNTMYTIMKCTLIPAYDFPRKQVLKDPSNIIWNATGWQLYKSQWYTNINKIIQLQMNA